MGYFQRADQCGQMLNLELEGHDDTILLQGEDWRLPAVASCTLGKYLGPRFGWNVATTRTTRCTGDCLQCDEVFLPGLDYAHIPFDLRFAHFCPFPQVEWDFTPMSEFEYADQAILALLAEVEAAEVAATVVHSTGGGQAVAVH